MATITQPRELLVNELQSMLYVEHKLAEEVLPELSDEVADDQLKHGFDEHLEQTRRHVGNLERALELLGEVPKADKSHAIDGLVAEHDKVVKRIDSDRLRDIFDAGAAAKTEHLEIAAYESMITAAEALNEGEVVSLLRQNLDEEKKALQKVEKVSEQIVG